MEQNQGQASSRQHLRPRIQRCSQAQEREFPSPTQSLESTGRAYPRTTRLKVLPCRPTKAAKPSSVPRPRRALPAHPKHTPNHVDSRPGSQPQVSQGQVPLQDITTQDPYPKPQWTRPIRGTQGTPRMLGRYAWTPSPAHVTSATFIHTHPRQEGRIEMLVTYT